MSEPSEAAMREAKGIVKEWQSLPDQRLLFLTKTIARSLDRFAAAQREEAIKIIAIHGPFHDMSPELLKILVDAIRSEK